MVWPGCKSFLYLGEVLHAPGGFGALGCLQCAAGVGDALGHVAELELCLGDVGVDDGHTLLVFVLTESGKGGLAGFCHVLFVAEPYVGGELEGGHASGVEEAGPRALSVGPGPGVGFLGSLQQFDGSGVAECGQFFGFAGQQPCAGRVVAVGWKELLGVSDVFDGLGAGDGVGPVGVGACLDDAVSALLGGESGDALECGRLCGLFEVPCDPGRQCCGFAGCCRQAAPVALGRA